VPLAQDRRYDQPSHVARHWTHCGVHTRIRGAVRALGEAARVERAATYERLAEQLALHAQTEEEVLYPAAVLVGDLIRARMAAR
jgi:hypothetical protein